MHMQNNYSFQAYGEHVGQHMVQPLWHNALQCNSSSQRVLHLQHTAFEEYFTHILSELPILSVQ